MTEFDIIGALETYAVSKGYTFIYGFDDMENNLATIGERAAGEIILIADAKATPSYSNGIITEISYNCLLMLGKKFDADGLAADIGETFKEKYTRRLQGMQSLLANFIKDFSCSNELEAESNELIMQLNMYAENLDFVVSDGQIFTQ